MRYAESRHPKEVLMRTALLMMLALATGSAEDELPFAPGDTCRISVFDQEKNDVDIGPWTTPKKAAEYYAWLSESRAKKDVVSFECKDSREEV
jgi:protein involved in polysaccharide export with SLBB domain